MAETTSMMREAAGRARRAAPALEAALVESLPTSAALASSTWKCSRPPACIPTRTAPGCTGRAEPDCLLWAGVDDLRKAGCRRDDHVTRKPAEPQHQARPWPCLPVHGRDRPRDHTPLASRAFDLDV